MTETFHDDDDLDDRDNDDNDNEDNDDNNLRQYCGRSGSGTVHVWCTCMVQELSELRNLMPLLRLIGTVKQLVIVSFN